MPLKVKTVTEREFQGAELPRIFAEGQKLPGNRFLNLFFEKLEHKKIETQNRMLAKDMEDSTTNYWRGFANGLIEARDLYDRLMKEVERLIRQG